jgi:hypothetical protein
MAKTIQGLEFDPGFAPYILAFRGTVEYLYTDINRFRNLSQKKVKFIQYHKKILEVFYNNVGFYTGCLLWAAYVKSQPEQEILSNPCLGSKYTEEDNTSETQYMLKFAELFPKDMKYFMGKDFEFDPGIFKLIKTYEEFLVQNKGFVAAKLTSDLVLPKSVKTKNAAEYKTIVDNAIKSQDLSSLVNEISTIL